MSLNSLEIENFTISLEFFTNLKIIMNELLNFIKEYKIATLKYYTRLQEIGNIYNNKTEKIVKEIKSKEKNFFPKLIYFINSIPKIIQLSTDNFPNFKEEIEKELKIYENLNPDLIIPSCKSQFEEIKNKLLNKEKEFKNSKEIFFNEMTGTENNIYTYYFSNQKNDLNNIDKYKKENVQKFELNNEEIMENNIKNSKQKETEYKNKAKEGRIEEENFLKFSRFYCESIKKITNEIFEKLKHLILDFLIALKNNFKIPQIEIDSLIPELIKLDKSLKMDKLLEKLYHNDNEYKSLFSIEKYNLQILQKEDMNLTNIKKNNNKSKNVIGEVEKKFHEIEDGMGKTSYISDYNAFLTIKKMSTNFELINLNNIDLSIEEEKIKMYNIITKILSNFKKEKDLIGNEEEEQNISEEELKIIESLIEKHYNRAIFFHLLNKFRSNGKFIMSQKMYEFFGKLIRTKLIS